MTKAALLTIGLATLLVCPATVPAQDNFAAAASTEALLRQANTIGLREKLSDARAMAQRGDIVGAAKVYQDSCKLALDIGSGIDAETRQAVEGLTTTRMALARDAQSRGNYREADLQVIQVIKAQKELKVEPVGSTAIAFKQQNDKMLAAMQGKMPSTEALDLIPQVRKEKIAVGTMVQDGKLLYEMGKLDEADAKLTEAYKTDPDNAGAYYYLNLTKQAKFARDSAQHQVDLQQRMEQVEKQWILPTTKVTLPVPNPYATNDLVYTGSGRQNIMSKLDHYRLDNVNLDPAVPLSEVVRYLNEQTKARDPMHKGINFIINPNEDKSGQAVAPPVTSTFGGGLGAAGAAGGFGGAAVFPGAGAVPGAAAIDPATGLPVTPTAGATTSEPLDVPGTMVKLSLTDVRLADVLDAIILVADKPIKYSITDFAVVFFAKGAETPQLFMREFRVDPNTFYSGLESVSSASFGASSTTTGGGGGGNNGGGGGGGGGFGGGGGGNSGGGGGGAVVGVVNAFAGAGGLRSTGGNGGGGGFGGGGGGGGNQNGAINPLAAGGGGGGAAGGGAAGGGGGGNIGGNGGLQYITQISLAQTPSEAARAFFNSLGLNLNFPKAVFFNDRAGTLLVNATEKDLDIIERALQVMNQIAPQVHIKARFIEVSQTDSKALGFDWTVGAFNLGSSVVGSGGTQPSLAVPVSAANPLGSFPGSTAAGVIPGAATDQMLTSGLRQSAPTLASFTGILTDPNFKVALRALEQRSGVENMGEPEATTTSGRQVQMRATSILSVVTGVNFQQGTAASIGNTGNGAAGN